MNVLKLGGSAKICTLGTVVCTLTCRNLRRKSTLDSLGVPLRQIYPRAVIISDDPMTGYVGGEHGCGGRWQGTHTLSFTLASMLGGLLASGSDIMAVVVWRIDIVRAQ